MLQAHVLLLNKKFILRKIFIVEKLKEERVTLTPARAMLLDVLCDMVSYGELISVFAAEKARLEKKVVNIDEFNRENGLQIK